MLLRRRELRLMSCEGKTVSRWKLERFIANEETVRGNEII